MPVNLVSPPATESSHAQTTDEVAPFAIEFCCGAAGLTAQLRKCGLRQSHGVDHIIKAGAKAPICKLDLTDSASENFGIRCAGMRILVSLVGHAQGQEKFHWDLMLQGHCAVMTFQKVLKTLQLQSEGEWTLQIKSLPPVADSSFVASSMESDGRWNNHIGRFSCCKNVGSKFCNTVSLFSRASMLACMEAKGQSRQH